MYSTIGVNSEGNFFLHKQRKTNSCVSHADFLCLGAKREEKDFKRKLKLTSCKINVRVTLFMCFFFFYIKNIWLFQTWSEI